MKIFKTMTFGMMCLFGVTVMAVEPFESVEKSFVEETSIQDNACSLTFSACNDLYPNDYYACMQRGGC